MNLILASSFSLSLSLSPYSIITSTPSMIDSMNHPHPFGKFAVRLLNSSSAAHSARMNVSWLTGLVIEVCHSDSFRPKSLSDSPRRLVCRLRNRDNGLESLVLLPTTMHFRPSVGREERKC